MVEMCQALEIVQYCLYHSRDIDITVNRQDYFMLLTEYAKVTKKAWNNERIQVKAKKTLLLKAS